MTPITIDKVRVIDLRFPTSREHIGSDAVNKDPDYSAANCILETNSGLSGHSLTFTLGRGTDLVVSALKYLAVYVESRTLDSITSDLKAFYLQVTSDTQFCWLGPEKGVIHLACAALLNAVWNFYAKAEGKPVWRLLADMTPEQIVSIIDFRYIADALSPDEALAILRRAQSGKDARLVQLERTGYPAYTTSAGWFGYSEDKIRRLCHEGLAEGWTHFKLKVGGDSEDDLHRGRIMRDAIGPHNHMMVGANQKRGVSEAIARTRQLAELQPWWMEEPTSPDDVLGHACIRREAAPTRIATGEHCYNSVVFKQFFQAGAIDVCQIDSCRVAGINENLSIILMAAKFGGPVYPHAGGVGLCEYVQHLPIFDFLSISATMDDRVIEYVDLLHEHFVTPVTMNRGRYMPPQGPGYSCEIRTESLQRYCFRDGIVWNDHSKSGGSV
ncbi:MAG: enolase C-terminal domain-like protein [Silvibacterium sp.]